MSRKNFLFLAVAFLTVALASGCGASAPTKPVGDLPPVEGDKLAFEIAEQGDITVHGFFLVGSSGAFEYALQYHAPREGVAMFFTVQEGESLMRRRFRLPAGTGVVYFNANPDWIDGAESIRLQLIISGSPRRTIITSPGR